LFGLLLGLLRRMLRGLLRCVRRLLRRLRWLLRCVRWLLRRLLAQRLSRGIPNPPPLSRRLTPAGFFRYAFETLCGAAEFHLSFIGS